MNISANSRQILTKFYGEGKAALDFGPDQIETLVSMVTDSYYRVNNGDNLVSTLAPSFLIRSSSFLLVRSTTIKFGQD